MNEQEVPESSGSVPPGDNGAPSSEDPSPPRAFGEVVSRRPWYLVVLVFPFGILLAAAPFLFHLERNDLPRVLSAYDAACQVPSPAIRCVNRQGFLPRIESVETPSGATEAFRLTLTPRAGRTGETEGRWMVVREGASWQVRDDPPTR
ncbi:MAG TPA: hypothetical protein PLQ97_02405 [Myxococcota bacterium]|nr:hypothetical protein [Myxococcota bacterium]HQK50683.1 hypothetical protein [Myxococcota bacterium]